MSRSTGPRVLVAHPSPELYGADRVALESVRAFVDAGWTVRTTVDVDGPLCELLRAAGSEVGISAVPVLRRSALTAGGFIRLVWTTVRRSSAMLTELRRFRPDIVYVSTLTVPWWLVIARLTGTRAVCHVHEAEGAVPRIVRAALAAPLMLAHTVIANSAVSRDILVDALPPLGRRIRIVYNGVAGPTSITPVRPVLTGPVRLVLVGRVSPRKGTDVAVAAVALLRERGVDVTLDLVGGVFTGYEWFEEQVRAQCEEADITDRVRWRGVLYNVWPALAEADIALVPSRVEPFGNVAVEAMLAGRPVIVSDTQGLREIVRQGENGERVPPNDPAALAGAVERVVTTWSEVRLRTATVAEDAHRRFALVRYRAEVAAMLGNMIGDSR